MRITWMRSLRIFCWPALGAAAVVLLVTATRAADIVPTRPDHGRGMPSAGTAPDHASGPSQDPQVVQLDVQIKAMRDEYHSQLDPLQAQVKALRDKYDPQLKSLEDQRWTLVEQGKTPEVQQLDAQEKTDLAALADREKAEVQAVRDRYTTQRKDLQQRYAERRQALQGHH